LQRDGSAQVIVSLVLLDVNGRDVEGRSEGCSGQYSKQDHDDATGFHMFVSLRSQQ
jgi:hypothetical protein